ncbi:MAG TPA: hypothetical protein VIH95_02610 [Acidimicrobiales bacterium]
MALAACSSSPASTNPTSTSSPFSPPTTASAASDQLCSLVNAADVRTIFGAAARAPYVIQHGTVTTCSFLAPNHGVAVSVHFDTGANSASFASEKAVFVTDGESLVAVTRLGDESFGATAASGQKTVSSVVVRKGTTEVAVTAPAPLSQVHSLVAQIVPKL